MDAASLFSFGGSLGLRSSGGTAVPLNNTFYMGDAAILFSVPRLFLLKPL